MTTLYEITQTAARLHELMDAATDDDEAQAIIAEAMDLLEGELSDKLEAYQAVRCGIDIDVAAIKAEEQRLAERRKSLEKRSEAMKQRMLDTMQLFGQQKVQTPRWTFCAAKTPPKVIIDDADGVPRRYLIPQPDKIDKQGIAEHLKQQPAQWAHLDTGFSLRIK